MDVIVIRHSEEKISIDKKEGESMQLFFLSGEREKRRAGEKNYLQ